MCHKFSLSKTICSKVVAICIEWTNCINILAGDDPVPVKFGPKGTDTQQEGCAFHVSHAELCCAVGDSRTYSFNTVLLFFIVKRQHVNCVRMNISVNHKPSIDECYIKLYAKPSPDVHERVVGTATCEDEDLEPLSVWVGDGLDFSRTDKGITKLEVNWQARYANPLSMPTRPTSSFFISNDPVQIGITGGRFTVQFDRK